MDLRLGAAIRTLLRSRGEGKKMCPSEAARVVGASTWRELLSRAREIAWELEQDGWLIVLQRGERVHSSAGGAIRLQKTQAG